MAYSIICVFSQRVIFCLEGVQVLARLITASVLVLICSLFTGCYKPYHEAVLVDIGTSEVAFLIETINEAKQASIAPPEKGKAVKKDGSIVSNYYAQRMISARKVEIPYYWKQTARVWFYDSMTNGMWKPAARLICVDTKPETREWHDDGKQAIWVESEDSVGFSTGVSITARIENQADAIVFLSNYPPESRREAKSFQVEVTSLSQIMDEEIRTKIQEVFAYEAAAYRMDNLRGKKREILDKIKQVVMPYFKERGITITAIGQFGGFSYENKRKCPVESDIVLNQTLTRVILHEF